MSVLHVSRHCHLDTIGGTERYQYDLMREGARLGLDSSLLWITSHARRIDTSFGEPLVTAVSPEQLLRRRRENWPAGVSLLHFHTFGPSELALSRHVRAMQLPYVFSYHSHDVVCRNSSLMRWTSTPCDGRLLPWRCHLCRAVSVLRSSEASAAISSRLRAQLRRVRPADSGPGQMSVRLRAGMLGEFLEGCSMSFVHSPASFGVLAVNGAKEDCIEIVPLGVSREFEHAGSRPIPPAGDRRFVIGYVGRLTRLKGFGTLVEAFLRARMPMSQLRLIGGDCDDPRNLAYAGQIRKSVEREPRVRFERPQPPAAMVSVYEELSVLAIPSLGAETGPLVLREGLRVGLPVLTSDRVGEADLARAACRIVRPNDVRGWERALRQAFEDVMQGRLTRGLPHASHPARRSMADVALQLANHYDTVAHRRRARVA